MLGTNAIKSEAIAITTQRTLYEYYFLYIFPKNSLELCEDFKCERDILLLTLATKSLLLCSLLKIKRITLKNIQLPALLYGCEPWSLTVKEERRLQVFENRVLRRIFGPKRDEVTGEWRKLHNEELNDLYSPPNIARVIKSRMR